MENAVVTICSGHGPAVMWQESMLPDSRKILKSKMISNYSAAVFRQAYNFEGTEQLQLPDVTYMQSGKKENNMIRITQLKLSINHTQEELSHKIHKALRLKMTRNLYTQWMWLCRKKI